MIDAAVSIKIAIRLENRYSHPQNWDFGGFAH